MKMILTLLLTLCCAAANAQRLEGTFKADKAFEEMANNYVEQMMEGQQLDFDADLNAGLSLFYMSDSITNIIIEVSAQVEKVHVDATVTFQGIYKREGDHMTCTYSKDDMDVAVMNIESFDPEVSQMLKDNEDTVYGVAEEQLRRAVEPHADKLFKATGYFKDYDILELTENTLRIRLEEGLEINLKRPE